MRKVNWIKHLKSFEWHTLRWFVSWELDCFAIDSNPDKMQDQQKFHQSRMESVGKECTQLKHQYEDCFNQWFVEGFLKGDKTDPCKPLFTIYSECLRTAMKSQKIDMKEIEKNVLNKNEPFSVKSEKWTSAHIPTDHDAQISMWWILSIVFSTLWPFNNNSSDKRVDQSFEPTEESHFDIKTQRKSTGDMWMVRQQKSHPIEVVWS